jgi:hypothetical protein
MVALNDIPIISDDHRRGISSTLVLLDEVLCRFERWAKNGTAKGPLYQERQDLSEEQRLAILDEIDSIRAAIADLRDELQLHRKVEGVATAIWFQCSWCWSLLVELESRRLKRYGELPAGFAAYFDPKVKVLIERMNAISEITYQITRRQETP